MFSKYKCLIPKVQKLDELCKHLVVTFSSVNHNMKLEYNGKVFFHILKNFTYIWSLSGKHSDEKRKIFTSNIFPFNEKRSLGYNAKRRKGEI